MLNVLPGFDYWQLMCIFAVGYFYINSVVIQIMRELKLFLILLLTSFCSFAQMSEPDRCFLWQNKCLSNDILQYDLCLSTKPMDRGGEFVGTGFLSKQKYLNPIYDREGFVMLNMAYSVAPQLSLGFTIGTLKTWGWFVSAAFSTEGRPKADRTDEFGTSNYYFTGSKITSRTSLQAGAMYRISYLLAAKFAVGYGMRSVDYATMENEIINISDQTFEGLDYSVGLHLDMGEVAFSLDWSTIGFRFKYSELKFGLGYSFKIKKPYKKKEYRL